jgi:hypothetical protein
MTQLPLVALNRPLLQYTFLPKNVLPDLSSQRAAEVVAAHNYSLSLRHERSAIPFSTNTTMS